MDTYPAKSVLWQYGVVSRLNMDQAEMPYLAGMLADRLDVDVDDLWWLLYENGHGGDAG